MAITHHLPLKDWYYDTTYQGTLDYPPLFAFLEFLLSSLAHHLNLNADGKLLKLSESPIRTDIAIAYQRSTVILGDWVYCYAVYKLCHSLQPLVNRSATAGKNADPFTDNKQTLCNKKESKNGNDDDNKVPENEKLKQQVSQDKPQLRGSVPQCLSDALTRPDTTSCVALLLLMQPGLLLVDHVHFQYNGLLNGILLLSIANVIDGRYQSASFWFSMLLNLKHIYLYCAPSFGMYFLSSYCLEKTKNQNRFLSFLIRAGRLGSIVFTVFLITYLPFVDLETLKQIINRLFPFKRGLTHAYWAPNAWALYNLADKILATVYKDSLAVKFDLESISKTRKISSTSGLVEEYEHQYLPTIKPLITFVLVGALTVPVVIKYLLFTNKRAPLLFMKGVALTSFTSFMFGWHVHEKAIITVLLPLIPVCYLSPKLWPTLLRLTLAGTYSLFPLLFQPAEHPTKVCLIVAYYSYLQLHSPPATKGTKHQSSKNIGYLRAKWQKIYPLLDKTYLFVLILNELYMSFIFGRINYDWNPVAKLNRFEFLPLLSTSSLSAIGIALSYLEIYFDFVLSEDVA